MSVSSIHHRSLRGGDSDDALLAPAAAAAPPAIATLTLPPQPVSAGRARKFVRDQARQAGFDEDALYEIDVAVGEAITNAIEHGCAQGVNCDREITLNVRRTPTDFEIEIRDPGAGFDPATARCATEEDPLAERGRGLSIMRTLMDELTVTPTGDGTVVWMRRRLP